MKIFSSTLPMETIHDRIKCQCFCVLCVDMYQLVDDSSFLCTALCDLTHAGTHVLDRDSICHLCLSK